MAEAGIVGGLAGSLLNITTDPARIDELYKLLGEYCHVFRNRLNSLKLSLYLARRAGNDPCAPPWAELERRYQDVENLIDRVQTICRPIRLDLIRLSPGAVLEDRGRIWAGWMARNGVSLALSPPGQKAEGTFDPNRLLQALDALVDWRSRAGDPGTSARLAWSLDCHRFLIEWEEQGPGRPAFDEETDEDRPAELALPLISRVMAAHGGTMTVGLEGGLRVRLRWPREVGTA
jgi:hypothetical protein